MADLSGCETSLALATTLSARSRVAGSAFLAAVRARACFVLQTLVQDHLGRETFKGTLSTTIVYHVEARQQDFQILMAIDRDAEHLTLHPTVEALDLAVTRRDGLGALAFG